MEWMKLSDLSWPEDFALIQGRPAVVVHLTKDGKELYDTTCIAKFDMAAGFFIAEDDIGLHAINPMPHEGDVRFLLLPELEGVELL